MTGSMSRRHSSTVPTRDVFYTLIVGDLDMFLGRVTMKPVTIIGMEILLRHYGQRKDLTTLLDPIHSCKVFGPSSHPYSEERNKSRGCPYTRFFLGFLNNS